MRDLKFRTAETKKAEGRPGKVEVEVGDVGCCNCWGFWSNFQLLAQFYQFGCWEMYFHIFLYFVKGIPWAGGG